MARKTKVQVIEELKAKGIEFDEKEKYNDLTKLLKGDGSVLVHASTKEITQIKLISKIPKRNTFLPDVYRDERDAEVLHRETRKREHKGKIKTITTVKHIDVSSDGFWITEFLIELKG